MSQARRNGRGSSKGKAAPRKSTLPPAPRLPAGGSPTPLNGAANGSSPYAGFRDPILVNKLGQLATNATSIRVADLAASAGDPRRSVEDECGYPPPGAGISIELYKHLYDRCEVANRAVQLMPKECWGHTPEVYETEDPADVTQFEQDWDALGASLTVGRSWYATEGGSRVWEYLSRLDTLSRIGAFGVLLIGLDDGRNLQEPVEGMVTLNWRDEPVVRAVMTRKGMRNKVVGVRRRITERRPVPADGLVENWELDQLRAPPAREVWSHYDRAKKAHVYKTEQARPLTANEAQQVARWERQRRTAEGVLAGVRAHLGANLPRTAADLVANAGVPAGHFAQLGMTEDERRALGQGLTANALVWNAARDCVREMQAVLGACPPEAKDGLWVAVNPRQGRAVIDRMDWYEKLGEHDPASEVQRIAVAAFGERNVELMNEGGHPRGEDWIVLNAGPPKPPGPPKPGGAGGGPLAAMLALPVPPPVPATGDDLKARAAGQPSRIAQQRRAATQQALATPPPVAPAPPAAGPPASTPVAPASPGTVPQAPPAAPSQPPPAAPPAPVPGQPQDPLRVPAAPGPRPTTGPNALPDPNGEQPSTGLPGAPPAAPNPTPSLPAPGQPGQQPQVPPGVRARTEWVPEGEAGEGPLPTAEPLMPVPGRPQDPLRQASAGVPGTGQPLPPGQPQPQSPAPPTPGDEDVLPLPGQDLLGEDVPPDRSPAAAFASPQQPPRLPEEAAALPPGAAGTDRQYGTSDGAMSAGYGMTPASYPTYVNQPGGGLNGRPGDLGTGGPPRNTGLGGTSADGVNQPPPFHAGRMAGTDMQYFGVQFGASELPAHEPAPVRRRVTFLRPYDESLVQVVRYEWNVNNPRFGLPVMYRVTLNDPRESHSGVGLPMATVFVHWSRVLHAADVHANASSSEVFAAPILRPILNRCLDMYKLPAAGAEGYWQSGTPTKVFETHPQLGGDVLVNESELRDQVEQLINSLQKVLTGRGGAWKLLAPSMVDPSPFQQTVIELIAIQLGCPVRIFKGSERGELASSQDDGDWNGRVEGRMSNYLTPRIVCPFVDRMIMLGAVAQPLEYHVKWPDLNSLGDAEKATIFNTVVGAIAAAIQGNVFSLIPPEHLLTKLSMGLFEDEEVQSWLEAAQAYAQEQLDAQADQMAMQQAQAAMMGSQVDMLGQAAASQGFKLDAEQLGMVDPEREELEHEEAMAVAENPAPAGAPGGGPPGKGGKGPPPGGGGGQRPGGGTDGPGGPTGGGGKPNPPQGPPGAGSSPGTLPGPKGGGGPPQAPKVPAVAPAVPKAPAGPDGPTSPKPPTAPVGNAAGDPWLRLINNGSPDQPRDERGRWAAAEGVHDEYINAPKGGRQKPVRDYVGGGDHYVKVNDLLRDKPATLLNARRPVDEYKPGSPLRTAVLLQKAIQEAPPVDVDRVYRGFASPKLAKALLKDARPGAEVRLDGFQSTSLNPDIATDFAEETGVMAEVRSPRGLLLGRNSYAGQSEMILPHGADYRVEGVEERGGKTVVILTQLNRGYVVGGDKDNLKVNSSTEGGMTDLSPELERLIDNYDPDQPRADDGRWTSGGGGGGGGGGGKGGGRVGRKPAERAAHKAETRKAAAGMIAAHRAGKPLSGDGKKQLAATLGRMTVKDLTEVAAEHGIKLTGRLKGDKVNRLTAKVGELARWANTFPTPEERADPRYAGRSGLARWREERQLEAGAAKGPGRDPATPPPPSTSSQPVHAPDVEADSDGSGVTDAARVGVPAMSVPPPPPIGRLPNLTPHERAVEKAFIEHYEANPDQVANDFLEVVRADAKPGEPLTFGTDDAKKLAEPWTHPDVETRAQNRATLNLALHQTANAITKRAFLNHLDTLKPGDEILVTVGGCGAGKGYALKNVPEALAMKGRSKAVWDSAGDQNATENPWIQREAEARGLKVNYVFVHADPRTQWAHPERGVVKRASDPSDGRMVDAAVFADSYAIGARNHQAFYERNKDNPNAGFAFLENSGKPRLIDGIPPEALALDRKELTEFARKVVKDSPAPPHIKRGGTMGVRVWRDES